MTRFSSLVAGVARAARRRSCRRPQGLAVLQRRRGGVAVQCGRDRLGQATVGKLVEKWRFPAGDQDLKIGVVHATPVVVDGHVYFGTVTQPTFYALYPNGKLNWSYQLAAEAQDRKSARQGRVAGGLWFSTGDRRHGLLRRPGRVPLRPRPANGKERVEGRHARRESSRTRTRSTAPSPRRSWPTARSSSPAARSSSGTRTTPSTRPAPAVATSWRSSRRPARSSGSTMSARSRSRSTRRSRSRTAGASTSSTAARRRAPSGPRPPTTQRRRPSSSAPTPTTPRDSRRRTTRGSIPSTPAP